MAFRWCHFKVNICCTHHYPVAQHGHISNPRSLHPGTSPEKPDRGSKINIIKCPQVSDKYRHRHYFTWETGPWQQDKQHQIPPGLRKISAQTVRNRLRENGLCARCPYFGAVLRCRRLLAWVRWCNRVRGWDLQNWKRAWFSDESRFRLQKRDRRTRVYRGRNERFARNCVIEVDHFGGGSVMMWGAISTPNNSTGAHPWQPYRRSTQRWGLDTTYVPGNWPP